MPTPGRLVFSPDGSVLAAVCGKHTIRLWHVATRKHLRDLQGHKGGIASLAFSPDGRYLASGGGGVEFHGFPVEHAIRLWDVATGKQLAVLDSHEEGVLSVAISPDGATLASGSKDGTVRVWEFASGKELFRFRDGASHPNSVGYAPDSVTLASAMSDGTVLLWSLVPPERNEVVGRRLSGQELDELWSRLSSEDVLSAYTAKWTFSKARHEEVLAYLHVRLAPVPIAKPGRIHRVIADLDHDDFTVREAANKELGRLGIQTTHSLQEALVESKSPEMQDRIGRLLRVLERWLVRDPETLRALRAIWVLERINTEDARAQLKRLARGASLARPTQEAQASLERLTRVERK